MQSQYSQQEDFRGVRSRLQETVQKAGYIFLLQLRIELDIVLVGLLQELHSQVLQLYTFWHRDRSLADGHLC